MASSAKCANCSGRGSKGGYPCKVCGGQGSVAVASPPAKCANCSGRGSKGGYPCKACGGCGWAARLR